MPEGGANPPAEPENEPIPDPIIPFDQVVNILQEERDQLEEELRVILETDRNGVAAFNALIRLTRLRAQEFDRLVDEMIIRVDERRNVVDTLLNYVNAVQNLVAGRNRGAQQVAEAEHENQGVEEVDQEEAEDVLPDARN